MSQISQTLDSVAGQNRAALIGYLPVGYPSVPESLEAMETLLDAGVDMVEIGVPYSDPVLDGPTIQIAVEAALRAGVRIADSLDAVRVLASHGSPPIVMSYANPLFQYGFERYAKDFAAAGGAGIITPDLTPDAAGPWPAAARGAGLDQIYLVAPSTTNERLALTVAATSGFVYAASLMGVTGERATVGEHAEALVARTRAAGAQHVCVGLGVSTGDQAHDVARYADGVIVGSALVRCLVDHDNKADRLAALRDKATELTEGVRRS